MVINRVVLAAIILMILLIIVNFMFKVSLWFFSIAMLILIIVAIVGYFKFD